MTDLEEFQPASQLAGIKVLLVDDEPDMRELLKMLLVEASADVVVAASADEGLAALRAARPDVILCDIGMPERDGYQMMRALRARPPAEGGWTPAIAVTGRARAEDHTRALLAGFQDHVPKPIEPIRLIDTIRRLAVREG